MKLYKRYMDRKGIGKLLSAFEELEHGTELPSSWFLICHGLTAFKEEICVKRGLGGPSELRAGGGRVLVLSTDPEDQKVATALGPLHESGLVRGLGWGLAARTEEQQEPWKTARLGEFLRVVGSLRSWEASEPPWQLLDRPRAPENLLACYLLVSIERELPESWKAAATAEYEAHQKLQAWPTLDFSRDGLASILRCAGGLGESDEDAKSAQE